MTTVHPPAVPALMDAAGTVDVAPVEALAEIDLREVPRALETGERIRRLEQRRRLLREQVAVALFLLVALAATVAVLAMQWLDSGPSTAGALPVSFAPAPASLLNRVVLYESHSGGIALTHSAGVLK